MFRKCIVDAFWFEYAKRLQQTLCNVDYYCKMSQNLDNVVTFLRPYQKKRVWQHSQTRI